MRVYTVDWAYNKDNAKEYYVIPYSVNGMLSVHFGLDFRSFCWKISFIPWYIRLTEFLKWAKRSRISKKSAQRLADKMNDCVKKVEV